MAVQKCFTCRICSHRLSSLLHGQTYKINDTILPTVESVRDLGVIVDHHLKFDARISLDVRKAMIRSRLILKCFFSRNKDLLLRASLTLDQGLGKGFFVSVRTSANDWRTSAVWKRDKLFFVKIYERRPVCEIFTITLRGIEITVVG